MFNLWHRRVSAITLLQLAADVACLFIAMGLALYLDRRPVSALTQIAAPALLFALLMVSINGAFGAYRHDRKLPLRLHVKWLFTASVILSLVASRWLMDSKQ